MSERYVLEESLYRTADGDVVRGDDPNAAFVYRDAGQTISVDEAKELGLVKAEPKQAAKPADKKRTPAKNKQA